MATQSTDILAKRRLKCVPKITFQFVDDYVRSKFKCKGEDTINKGLKYFVEGYIAQIQGTVSHLDVCGFAFGPISSHPQYSSNP